MECRRLGGTLGINILSDLSIGNIVKSAYHIHVVICLLIVPAPCVAVAGTYQLFFLLQEVKVTELMNFLNIKINSENCLKITMSLCSFVAFCYIL